MGPREGEQDAGRACKGKGSRKCRHLLVGHDLANQDLGEHEVAIHRLCDNARHLRVRKLHERVVLGRARLLVSRQPEPCHITKLREEAAHLLLIEAVRDVAEVEDGAGPTRPALVRARRPLLDPLRNTRRRLCIDHHVDPFSGRRLLGRWLRLGGGLAGRPLGRRLAGGHGLCAALQLLGPALTARHSHRQAPPRAGRQGVLMLLHEASEGHLLFF